MATASAVTAEDVALELVATKMAISEILDGLTGTTPTRASRAMLEWALSSPVEFPRAPDAPDQLEHAFSLRLFQRSSFIQAEMLSSAAAYLTALARSEREFAEGYESQIEEAGRHGR